MKTLAACLLLACLAGGLFVHRVLVSAPDVHGIESADMVHYMHPTAIFVHGELRKGNLPIWNPYQLAGVPFVAIQQPGVLYPPNLVLLGLLSPDVALSCHFVLHLWIAGIFTWLLAARLGLGTAGRFVAAVGFAGSVPMIAGLYNPTYLSSQAWLPAVFFAVHGLATEGRLRWAGMLCAALALAFLGGHAQAFLFELQAGAAYGLFALVFVTQPGRRLRTLALAGLGGLGALLCMSPQLLPALELAVRGVRDLGGVPLDVAAFGSVTPFALLRGLVGLPHVQIAAGLFQSFAVLPVLIVPLVVSGFFSGSRLRNQWIFFLAAAVFAGVYMLGAATPLYPALHELPLGALFRGPMRAAFVYAFLAAVLAAIGTDVLATHIGTRLPGAPGTLAIGLLLCVLGVDVYRWSDFASAHPAVDAPAFAPPDLVDRVGAREDRARLFVGAPQDQFPPPTVLYKAGTAHRLFAVPDYEPTLPAAYARYFGADRQDEIWRGRVALFPPRPPQPERELLRLLDLMSVHLYALDPKLGFGNLGRLRRLTGGTLEKLEGVWLLERDAALPRVYAVRRAHEAETPQAARARILDPSFEPLREAVIDARPPHGFGGPPPSDAGSDRVSIARYETERVDVDVDCAADCLLVLTDLHYPGWVARVDGEAREIHGVNTLFRGVFVAPGEREVVFSYEPLAFRIGLGLAASAALAAAILALAAGRWRTAQEADPGRRR